MKSKMKLLVLALIALGFLKVDVVMAGNPAPLYHGPVHLGGGNPNYGKRRKKKKVVKKVKKAVASAEE